MGSWVPLQIMSAAFAPHCWNGTSFADPEYVMDLGSPRAFCAFAMTVLASCAIALPPRHARLIATRASLFTASPPLRRDWCPGDCNRNPRDCAVSSESRLGTIHQRYGCPSAKGDYHPGGPGMVRVWWNVYSPSTRSSPFSSTAKSRAIIDDVGEAFAHMIDC